MRQAPRVRRLQDPAKNRGVVGDSYVTFEEIGGLRPHLLIGGAQRDYLYAARNTRRLAATCDYLAKCLESGLGGREAVLLYCFVVVALHELSPTSRTLEDVRSAARRLPRAELCQGGQRHGGSACDCLNAQDLQLLQLRIAFALATAENKSLGRRVLRRLQNLRASEDSIISTRAERIATSIENWHDGQQPGRLQRLPQRGARSRANVRARQQIQSRMRELEAGETPAALELALHLSRLAENSGRKSRDRYAMQALHVAKSVPLARDNIAGRRELASRLAKLSIDRQGRSAFRGNTDYRVIRTLCSGGEPGEPGSKDAELLRILSDYYWEWYSRTESMWALWHSSFNMMNAYRALPKKDSRRAEYGWLAGRRRIQHIDETGSGAHLMDLVTEIDGDVPSGHPLRVEVSNILGALCSASASRRRGRDRLDAATRCAAFFEESARLSRRGGGVEDLAHALAQAGASRGVLARALRSSGCSHRTFLRHLDRGIEYLREACQLQTDERAASHQLVLSFTLSLTGRPSDLEEAVQIQRVVLSENGPSYPAHLHMDYIFWPKSDVLSDDHLDLLLRFVAQRVAVDSPKMWSSIVRSAVDAAFDRGRLEFVVDVVLTLLDRAPRLLMSPDPLMMLWALQGYAADGALAAARLNRAAQSAEILERGAALRYRETLAENARREPAATSHESTVSVAPSLRRLPRISRSHELAELARSAASPLFLVACGSHAGLVVCVEADGHVWTSEVAELNEAWVLEQVKRLDASASAHERAGPSESALSELVGSLHTLRTAIGEGRAAIDLVAVGIAASLPLRAALETGDMDVSVHPSASLLLQALRAAKQRGRPVAITSAEPCTLDGVVWPVLDFARREGQSLERRRNAEHVWGSGARRQELLSRLDVGSQFLHLAVHGESNPDGWDAGKLIFADDPVTGQAETVTVEDIVAGTVNVELIFLAACWGGTPNRTLPDEAVSFPSAFLAAGARTVLAPLWPVDDDAAEALVSSFYNWWLGRRLGPAEALRRASREVRDSPRFAGSTTWAAFSLAGVSRDEMTAK